MYTYLLRPWQFNAFVLNTVPGERQSERDTLGRDSVNQSKRKKANNVKDTDMYTNVSITYIYIYISAVAGHNFYKVLDAKPGS